MRWSDFFFQNRCEKPCQHGKHGKNCASTCQCQNGATCIHTNGSCICAPGKILIYAFIPFLSFFKIKKKTLKIITSVLW